jgi:hypothetical protein
MSKGVLTGRMEVDGRAAAGQRVLLVSGDMGTLLASAETSEAGAFELPLPGALAGDTIVLLAKVQGPLLAVAHRVVDLAADAGRPQDFAFDSQGPEMHELHAAVSTTADWPPYLRIVVDPVELTGIPAPLARFFLRRDERVVEESFLHLHVEEREFTLRVQAGTYRIGGGYRIKSRLMATPPQVSDYVVGAVEVTVDGDTDVGLTIEPVVEGA